ncbi:MAG: hypothetical protein Hyperionvirus13_49 [Hyperionvirus sp.]|uniref:Uncharacterized protein n=1 Tax=Hyperionvirus sp. TaxID=2487770 RepID=A0A3G5A9F0_9VIRU|nr:MAG: hypothetical protein Hyperionvirus13_49 [Hyperionvirus sp.]
MNKFIVALKQQECRIISDYTTNEKFISETDIHKLNIPDIFLENAPWTNFKKNGKVINISFLKDCVEKLQHPHVYYLQSYSGFDIKYKKAKEIVLLARITKIVGSDGIYQYPVKCPDAKRYVMDYAYLNEGEPLIIIEIHEKHHDRIINVIADSFRNEEIEELSNASCFVIPYDISDEKLDHECEEMKAIREHYDDEITLKKMENEFTNYPEFDKFAESFGEELIADTLENDNPFKFPLASLLRAIDVRKNSEQYELILSYFVVGCAVDDVTLSTTNDDIDENWGNDVDEVLEDVEYLENKEKNHLTSFELNIDFIKKEGEYYLTRDTLNEIAIQTNTPLGVELRQKFRAFEKMIQQFIVITNKRRKDRARWINERRLKRAYESRALQLERSKNRELESLIRRKDKLLDIFKEKSKKVCPDLEVELEVDLEIEPEIKAEPEKNVIQKRVYVQKTSIEDVMKWYEKEDRIPNKRGKSDLERQYGRWCIRKRDAYVKNKKSLNTNEIGKLKIMGIINE